MERSSIFLWIFSKGSASSYPLIVSAPQLGQLTSLIHRLRDEAPAEAGSGRGGGRLLQAVGSFASVNFCHLRQAIESMEIALARLRKEQVVKKSQTNGGDGSGTTEFIFVETFDF